MKQTRTSYMEVHREDVAVSDCNMAGWLETWGCVQAGRSSVSNGSVGLSDGLKPFSAVSKAHTPSSLPVLPGCRWYSPLVSLRLLAPSVLPYEAAMLPFPSSF